MAEARILYVATDDGLIQFANPGRSDRWREVGRALDHQPVRAVVAAPNDPLLIVAATADAVHRTTDGGFSWEAIWQGEATALAFADDGTLYVGTQQGVLLRQNAEQWEEAFRARGPITSIVGMVDPPIIVSDARMAYEETTNGDYEALVAYLHSRGIEYVAGLSVPPFQPDPTTVVYELSDAGPINALEFLTGAVVVLGGNDFVLLVGTRNALLRSTTPVVQGEWIQAEWLHVVALSAANHEGFEPVPGPQNVTALVTPPRFIDQVFATTKSGELWFSSDRGRTWAALRTDLPPANDLAFVRAR